MHYWKQMEEREILDGEVATGESGERKLEGEKRMWRKSRYMKRQRTDIVATELGEGGIERWMLVGWLVERERERKQINERGWSGGR